MHGGRGGLYYRKQLGSKDRSHRGPSGTAGKTTTRPAEQTPSAPDASGCLRVLSIVAVPLAFVADWRAGVAVVVLWQQHHQSAWKKPHEDAYTRVFSEALNDGIDDDARTWVGRVASTLMLTDAGSLETEALKVRLWEFMADGEVTKEEEKSAGTRLS